ncbi:alpha/beta fold hydrolase [Streptomyces fuscigenes]|uniref:alpha/beta fold hydrolase n=1 Tax=Streptomyces fuscigenes TaxID=1528880 RepID=UPI001F39B4DF|nr:alpha/beta hydrolase [Streptomyces fuscigenes]MCF3964886.1 alpha/beta hydrolase [Streptomyces fuscigenes]
MAERFVESGGSGPEGVRLRVFDEGEGPLVVLLHGFPEGPHSWRHQIGPLVAAGYRVLVPEQRGYGASSRPEQVGAYSVFRLVGDVAALIADAGAEQAVVVGHDWGASVAWRVAALRPDLVRAVAGLSVPPSPRGRRPPLEGLRELHGGRFYMNHIADRPGVADAEMAADVRRSLRAAFHGLSGENPANDPPRPLLVPEGAGLPEALGGGDVPPSWLTEDDLEQFARLFDPADGGFTGALNWYRTMDTDWPYLAAFDGVRLRMPALFMAGDRDTVLAFPDRARVLARLARLHPGLREPVILPGCGHWIQQERPAEVTARLLEFLGSLGSPGRSQSPDRAV